jgi:hypothetical protein
MNTFCSGGAISVDSFQSYNPLSIDKTFQPFCCQLTCKMHIFKEDTKIIRNVKDTEMITVAFG